MDAPALPPANESEQARPLLSPALLGPAAILWLWVLPMVVLLALNLQGYRLIEGNMDAAQHTCAHRFGLAGLLNALAGLGLYFAVRRRPSAPDGGAVARFPWCGLAAIVIQTAYLWMAAGWSDDLLPRTVTDWIYTPQRFFYNQFAFAMLPLFWGMIRLACARSAKGIGRAIAFNLALAVAAPVALFVLFQVIGKLRWFDHIGPVFVAILVIVSGLLMFVGLMRGLALGLRNIDTWKPLAERVAILVFALVLPAGGLWLNRTMPFPNDFQAWEVYALTLANAAILLLASWQHGKRPLLSLGLLCVTLPFTLYFFVVFLPFLPLSVLAVTAMGAGFLVLTPTLLLVLHLNLLNKARRGSGGWRLLTGVVCFLFLPGFFTVRGLADKAALNAALNYIYAPSIKADPITYPYSVVNLKRALANHRAYKNGIYYPLLSDYYAWLVFDDLVLPDDKLARLETAFLGSSASAKNNDPLRSRENFFGGRGSVRDRNHMPRSAPPPRTVIVDSLGVGLAPAAGDATTVTLTFTLRNTGDRPAEYMKTLPLPAGVFVSGFRLRVDGKAVPGRITEKKTALWVYTMIRDSERRDPGLLFFNAPDELELRVFPVAVKTQGVVEIDLLAPARIADPAALGGSNDAVAVLAKLGGLLHPTLVKAGGDTVVAGGLEALALPAAPRESCLHVIVDRSADNGFDGDLPAVLRMLAGKFPDAHAMRITLANYETAGLPSESASLDTLPLRGGLVADLALAQAIRKHRDGDLDTAAPAGAPPVRPVFVILGRKLATVAPKLEVANAWTDLLPALEIYAMDAGGALTVLQSGGRAEKPLLRLGNSVRPLVSGRAVRFKAAGPEARLEYWESASGSWKPVDGVTTPDAGGPWTRAVALQARQQDHDRTPGDAATDLKTLVKESRESGVMLASTSYTVVENQAQWRMLDMSERKKLDQNAALNFKEAPAPSWVWMAGGFALWLVMRRVRPWRRSCGADA